MTFPCVRTQCGRLKLCVFYFRCLEGIFYCSPYFIGRLHSFSKSFLSAAMRSSIICLHWFVALGVRAQSTDSSTGTGSSASSNTQTSSEASSFAFTNSLSIIPTTVTEVPFTGSQYTYATHNGQSEVTGTTAPSSGTASSTSASQSIQTTQHQNVTQISGSNSQTATTTSSAPAVSNTVPCNNYPEFCSRKYSNITEVCAHNSAFSIKNNAASNQVLSIVDQLDDGVRMSMHFKVKIMYMILIVHSSGRSSLGQQYNVFLPYLM